jgi:uncharacterized protein YlzI (FlbEa/FlbD family)
MKEIDKFAEIFERKLEGTKQAQLRFATCKAVNWDEKTMTVTGVSDGVDYRGVQLGFEFVYIKPKIGAVCLIGILEGKEALTFLINAETVELMEVNADTIEINGGNLGGLVKSEVVADRINALERKVNQLITTLSGITVPAAGLVFAPIFASVSQILPLSQKNDFENEKIKQ